MESIAFAIKMELDGEEYYRRQAENNRGNALCVVFEQLADDERAHAGILEDLARGIAFRPDFGTAEGNVFDRLGEIKSQIKPLPEQWDVYRGALDIEKDSIELYRKMLSGREGDRALFEYLIDQEESHFRLIDQIADMVGRPREWIEAPEFGVREEY